MKHKFLLLSAFILFISILVMPISKQSESDRHFIAPPPLLEHYAFGMRPQMADLLWLRSLQDFDYCENYVSKNTCKGQSWLYKMIETLTNLDNSYFIAYSVGGLALTIIISDYEGASKIFDKGVALFPKAWTLLFRAGYHALYEEKDFAKASKLFKDAGENGGPPYTLLLADRLKTKQGQLGVSQWILDDLIRRGENESLIQRMREKIEEIKNRPE